LHLLILHKYLHFVRLGSARVKRSEVEPDTFFTDRPFTSCVAPRSYLLQKNV
jgi:hypothetical protein